MQMSIGMLDHYNVSTRKLQETVQFYQDVLGFVKMKNNANKVPRKNRIPKFRLLLFAVTSAYPESLAKARSVGGTVLDQYKSLGEAPAVKGLQEIGLPGLRVTEERVSK